MNNTDEKMDLEQAMETLQKSVEALESPDLKLEERIEMYEKAGMLALKCRKMLADAKLRIIDINERIAQNEAEG